MFKRFRWPRLAVNRFGLLATGVSFLATAFHFFVAAPRAQAYAAKPAGWERLSQVIGTVKGRTMPSTQDPNVEAQKPVSKSPVAAPGTKDAAQTSEGTNNSAPGTAMTTADPALLELLQRALRERRDGEYIYRLRHFQRRLRPIQCPPLPSYSVEGIELSDQERSTLACHEQRHLQAQCVLPTDLFSPTRCPRGYQWRLEDDRIESERQWLAARTAKK